MIAPRAPRAIDRLMKAATALGICALAAACAWTQMSTYRDPASKGRPPFKKLAIFAIVSDLGERQLIEDDGVDAVQKMTQAEAVRAIDILPPTRAFTAEEAAQAFAQAGIDGVLFVILTNSYVDTYQTPGTATTTGFASVYRNSTYGTVNYQSQTTYVPGAVISKPREAHELKLADVKSGGLVWISSSFTRGNAFADEDTMADSMLKSAIDDLIGEDLLLEKVTPR